MLKRDFNKIAKQLLPNKSVSIKKVEKAPRGFAR